MGSCLVCSALVVSCLVCSALVGSSPVCSALVLCSASDPDLVTSTWTWPSVPPPVPPPLHQPSWIVLNFEERYVMNLVYELLLTHHQKSLAHHMYSCPTLTVALHLRQFPSSIALTTHTADCTDHTLYINHGLPLLLCQYCIAFITLLAIATLRSPLSYHSLALCVLITAPCFLD